MYLAMPVTNAFRSSKLVLKLGCGKKKNNVSENDIGADIKHVATLT